MVSKRLLSWSECGNTRDLGGLPLRDDAGRTTKAGALVRSDTAERLTADGWDALRAHGVRTVIDLRNDDERAGDAAPRPADLDTLRLPHDGLDEGPEFWATWGEDPRFASPLFFLPHLERFPHRSARVLQAIAHARPGGVLVHCQGGRDRAGIVSALALTVAGVAPEAIADDYALSFEGPGAQDTDDAMVALLAAHGLTPREAMLAVLADDGLQATLARGGLTAQDAAALRARLT